MNTENKSTELENTDKKLHISDVSDSFFKTEFQEGYTDGYSTTYFKKYEEYELFVTKYKDNKLKVGFIQGDMMEVKLGEYSLYDLLILMKVLK